MPFVRTLRKCHRKKRKVWRDIQELRMNGKPSNTCSFPINAGESASPQSGENNAVTAVTETPNTCSSGHNGKAIVHTDNIEIRSTMVIILGRVDPFIFMHCLSLPLKIFLTFWRPLYLKWVELATLAFSLLVVFGFVLFVWLWGAFPAGVLGCVVWCL